MAVGKDNTRVSVKLSKQLREQLERDASAENRSVSNYIEYRLERLVESDQLGKELPLLLNIAQEAEKVMIALYEGSRDNVSFTALADALERAGYLKDYRE